MFSLNGTGGSFVYAESVSSPPTFAADEKRAVTDDSTTNGTPNAVIFGGGVGTDGVYDSGILVGNARFDLSLSGQDLVVPIRAVNIRMTISSDGLKATEGTISGVAPTEQLVAAMGALMGRFSTDLCTGTTRDGILDSIRQASDIMQDGSQDPNKECDGISVGLGFEATRVVVGDIAPAKAPPADPCN